MSRGGSWCPDHLGDWERTSQRQNYVVLQNGKLLLHCNTYIYGIEQFGSKRSITSRDVVIIDDVT